MNPNNDFMNTESALANPQLANLPEQAKHEMMQFEVSG